MEMNDQSWIFMLGNFGFPAVITMYLLVRFEKKIDSLEEAINNLSNIISSRGSSK